MKQKKTELHRKFTSLKWMIDCRVHEVFLGATVASMVHPCLPWPSLVQFMSLTLMDQ